MPARSRPPASDFASAAMLRVLAQGMRDLGLNPEPGRPGSADHAATVSLDQKRQLLGAALAQGGLGCLALLGRGLHRYAHEPTHSALVSARDAADLLARWARLERYIHSRHHIEVLAVSDGHAHIVHRARPTAPPPLPAEDLVVLGVLAALLEAMGATDVTARVGEVPVYPEPDPVALAMAAECRATARWTLQWACMAVPPRRAGTGPADTPEVLAAPAWPATARHAFKLLCAEPMNPLTLPALAQALGVAPRSLQRSWSGVGLSHTRLLAEARCRTAAGWLMRTATPIAEVGFLSGYADQPHFTRDFHRRVGMTPLRYRNDFSHAA